MLLKVMSVLTEAIFLFEPLSYSPLALLSLTLFVCVDAAAMLFASVPQAFVGAAIGPEVFTVAFFQIGFITTDVFPAITP